MKRPLEHPTPAAAADGLFPRCGRAAGAPRWWLAAALAMACVASAWAQRTPVPGAVAPPLGPRTYFDCQVAGRAATIAGLQERARLMATAAGAGAMAAAAEQSRQRVEAAFTACGHDAPSLAAYAHREDERLRAWLAAHPAVQQRLAQQQQQVQQLSVRMSASAPPPAGK